MQQFGATNYSPASSSLRHTSTDSSIPSPYGGDILADFHLDNVSGTYSEVPNFDMGSFDNLYYGNTQLPSPPIHQMPLPNFSTIRLPIASDPVPHISPGGHGNHVLYTPTSLKAMDEGFEDYSSGEENYGDYTLFPSTTNSVSSGTNPQDFPLFGEMTQEMYPSFLSTQECMELGDLGWPNTL